MSFIFYPPLELFVALYCKALMICCVSAAFSYGFSLLQTYLQEASFYSVRGHLLRGEKPSVAGRKDTV